MSKDVNTEGAEARRLGGTQSDEATKRQSDGGDGSGFGVQGSVRRNDEGRSPKPESMTNDEARMTMTAATPAIENPPATPPSPDGPMTQLPDSQSQIENRKGRIENSADSAFSNGNEGTAPRSSMARKVGLGVALVAVPLGVVGVYRHLEQTTAARNDDLRESWKYDTSAIRHVDPSLVKYAELTRIETGMSRPQAIALDAAGNLLVAGEGLVRRLDSRGMLIQEFAIEGTPTCVAADADGSLFVGFTDRVEIFGADGQRTAVWPSFGERSHVTGISATGGQVLVADAGRRLVLRCDRDGKVLAELGRRDESRGVPGLNVPSPHLDAVFGPDGLIWLANPGLHRLEAYTPDGLLTRFWGTRGAGIESFYGCCNPADFAILPDGSFITAEKQIARIKRYDADGVFQSVVAPPAAFGDNMLGMDVAVNAQGQVLVLERGTRVVRVFAPVETGEGAMTKSETRNPNQ